MYGLVALAPRWYVNLELKAERQANKKRLLALEREVSDMQSVLDAVENDPEFKAELASVGFSAKRPEDESILVDERLKLDTRSRSADITAEPVLPWFAVFLEPLAKNTHFRGMTLFAAAVLTIVAFTFVQESQEAELRTSVEVVRSFIHAAKSRYKKN